MGGYVTAGLQLASLVAGQQQGKREEQALAERVDAQNRYLVQQQQIQDQQRRDLLARQLATARARLGAGGMGLGGGSAQALMAGMVKDGEREIAADNALLHTRIANSGIGFSSSDGLLEGLTTVQKGIGIFGSLGNGQN
ncbi:MAG TPA: hypothetical protein VK196_03135 [Magnetospirillum sp.]|nr:hypothetical protein [Magnetospirillum sp.]